MSLFGDTTVNHIICPCFLNRRRSFERKEIIKQIDILDLVLLSLCISSNYKCNTAHGFYMYQTHKQYCTFKTTQKFDIRLSYSGSFPIHETICNEQETHHILVCTRDRTLSAFGPLMIMYVKLLKHRTHSINYGDYSLTYMRCNARQSRTVKYFGKQNKEVMQQNLRNDTIFICLLHLLCFFKKKKKTRNHDFNICRYIRYNRMSHTMRALGTGADLMY